MDLSFLVDDSFAQSTGIVVQLSYALVYDKLHRKLDTSPDWTALEVMCTLDCMKKVFQDQGGDLVAATAIYSIVTKMGDSLYLFSDENLIVMLCFCLDVGPSLRDLELDLLKSTSSRLRERENEGNGQQAAATRNLLLIIDPEYVDPNVTQTQSIPPHTYSIDIRDVESLVQGGLHLFS